MLVILDEKIKLFQFGADITGTSTVPTGNGGTYHATLTTPAYYLENQSSELYPLHIATKNKKVEDQKRYKNTVSVFGHYKYLLDELSEFKYFNPKDYEKKVLDTIEELNFRN